MAIVLDHTIVPAHDNESSARSLRASLGCLTSERLPHFAPVQEVNETLVLDFDTRTTFDWHHYAFKVEARQSSTRIFQRVIGEGLCLWQAGRSHPDDMAINHQGGGRGFYFKDPNGHLLEVLTVRTRAQPACPFE